MILANITKLCKSKGISVARLERETGIGNGTISRWENSSPTIDSVRKVAKFFEVTIDELISDTLDEPNT